MKTHLSFSGLSYASPELKYRTDLHLFYLHSRLMPCGTGQENKMTLKVLEIAGKFSCKLTHITYCLKGIHQFKLNSV